MPSVTLRVENLSVKLSEPPKQILDAVSLHVKPGQLLAVMGPSGSGKTTLLSALSGRIKSTGRISLNGYPLNKTLRRQICYVLQNDVFFANLTLRQTLVYAAMLRLPDSMSHESKTRQVDQVIDALDLRSCQHTVIGDYMRRGLSGGEKKRVSIACELLSNPSVMMLDEPTSSLDSCNALSLIRLLKEYAMKEQKTIVISIHQPSSQIFYLFDKLLLLSQGQMMYFGSILQAVPYFQSLNYYMQHISYNPADFLIETIKKIDKDNKELARLASHAREYFFSSYMTLSSLSSASSTTATVAAHTNRHSLQSNSTSLSSSRSLKHHHHHHHLRLSNSHNADDKPADHHHAMNAFHGLSTSTTTTTSLVATSPSSEPQTTAASPVSNHSSATSTKDHHINNPHDHLHHRLGHHFDSHHHHHHHHHHQHQHHQQDDLSKHLKEQLLANQHHLHQLDSNHHDENLDDDHRRHHEVSDEAYHNSWSKIYIYDHNNIFDRYSYPTDDEDDDDDEEDNHDHDNEDQIDETDVEDVNEAATQSKGCELRGAGHKKSSSLSGAFKNHALSTSVNSNNTTNKDNKDEKGPSGKEAIGNNEIDGSASTKLVAKCCLEKSTNVATIINKNSLPTNKTKSNNSNKQSKQHNNIQNNNGTKKREKRKKRTESKWPSSFMTQLYALTSRNFIDGRARMLSKLNWIQTIGIALIAGSIWFQTKRTEETLNDIKGWMYFSTMYWMMFALFNAITSFPAECQVINKERLAGSYRLSSYYMAKMVGELPLVIALPSAFHLISYPLLGFQSFYTFTGLWGFAILNSLAAQSVGMFIGFTCNSLDLCVTIAAIYSAATSLFGGFYSSTMPHYLSWLRYGSVVYYGYLNMQMVEFGTGAMVTCAGKNSKYPSCQLAASKLYQLDVNQHSLSTNNNSSDTSIIRQLQNLHQQIHNQHQPKIDFSLEIQKPQQLVYIPRNELMIGLDPMADNGVPNPVWFNTLCLMAFLVVFRVVGYIVLRVYHKPA